MDCPKYLDDEDMTLALKEWKLTGCKITSGSHEGLGWIDVFDPDDEMVVAGYLQRSDGGWVDVPHKGHPQWEDARIYAENYDVGT